MLWFSLAALGLWLATLMVPWRPWSTRERLESDGLEASATDLRDICALIPARNEEAHIESTLNSLCNQGSNLQVFVIDDESQDQTAVLAERINSVSVIRGRPLERGWTGKLWALEQGLRQIRRPMILLLDADIRLEPNILASARAHLIAKDLGMLSLMADLRKESLWERLLMPPFVFFFKLLYPFHLSNKPYNRMAAAAGGFVLIRTEALESIGGFSALQGAIIDDCTLAARVKAAGYPIWTGLTRAVISQRIYSSLEPIFAMVARTAFTQLRHSIALLLLCTVLMLIAFGAAPVSLIFGSSMERIVALAAILLMMIGYVPTLRYYQMPWIWALSLPLAGSLFLVMTWASAMRYWKGEQTRWKGRSYQGELKSPH